MSTYKPNCTDDQIQQHSVVRNISGRSPKANITIEEGAQKRVATSEVWQLAKQAGWLSRNETSRRALEEMGFTILDDKDDLFFKVQPPAGWTKATEGYWTYICDADRKERLTQFYKGAWYDSDAFLNLS